MNILITGASRGIGAELAAQLAPEASNLILLSRNEKALQLVAENCNKLANKQIAHPIPFDLNEINQNRDELLNAISTATHDLDVLVNNAGLLINKAFEETSLEESKMIFEINYFAPSELIRLCLPFLGQKRTSSVINITSMGAVQGSVKFAGLSTYSASKGALTTLTECLAEEFREKNIKVNALALGSVQTEMLTQAFPGYKASASVKEMTNFVKWFTLEGWKRFNGKMLPVSDSTP